MVYCGVKLHIQIIILLFCFILCRQQKHPFERVATPYQIHSWMAPTLEHNIDYIRAEDGNFLWTSVHIFTRLLVCYWYCWVTV
jgi:hypothetical protein